MNSRENILSELKELNSSLLPAVASIPMTIPERYFASLPSRLLARLHEANNELASLSPLLAGISKQMPYSVPQDYFEQGLSSGLNKQDDGIESIFSEDRVTPYVVPTGYFDQLPGKLSNRVTKADAKVVTMVTRRWMRMSIAAVVAGFIAVSGFLYFQGKGTNPPVQSEAWIHGKLKSVSDKDLEEFIKTTDPVPADNLAQASNSTTEVRHMLKDVSQKEIDAFLDDLPAEDAVN